MDRYERSRRAKEWAERRRAATGSARAVARECKISVTAVLGLLDGEMVAQIGTIEKIEAAMTAANRNPTRAATPPAGPSNPSKHGERR